MLIHVIVDAVLQRHVKTEVLAKPRAIIVQLARAREKVPGVFMKRNGHDAVRMVECELDAIAVMDVDVDVQHARMVFEHLQYSKHSVINVAKSICLAPLGMMKAAGPIDGSVCGAC